MKTFLFILGTRPEVIKLSPIILKFLEFKNKYKIIICNTEQQKQLSNQALNYFNLKSDISLDIMRENQSLSDTQSKLLVSIDEIFKKTKIDCTFVQGDTITAFSGALVSYFNQIPICHIEAGLRSYNLFEPFPEESLRQMISRISTFHFSPTVANKEALLKENISENSIYVVGNSVIDALHSLSKNAKKSYEYFKKLGINIDNNFKLVLITIHRRENHGKRINIILKAIKDLLNLYKDHIFIIPAHPNPNVKKIIHEVLQNYNNAYILEPLEYPHLVFLMRHAKLILTDSGGIQEEAPTFGCPVLVLRYKTERMEGIDTGISKLVGADYELILQESKNILNKTFYETRLKSINPYGDGKTSQKIFEIIKNIFN